jgi:hypothetical protein
MGVTASDARRAVKTCPGPGTVEERMRAALGALRTIYASRGAGTRCEEPLAMMRGRAPPIGVGHEVTTWY